MDCTCLRGDRRLRSCDTFACAAQKVSHPSGDDEVSDTLPVTVHVCAHTYVRACLRERERECVCVSHVYSCTISAFTYTHATCDI
jgi:hypothetical protein